MCLIFGLVERHGYKRQRFPICNAARRSCNLHARLSWRCFQEISGDDATPVISSSCLIGGAFGISAATAVIRRSLSAGMG